MTRRDTILKWIAYGIALAAIAILNYYILGALPIPIPLLPLMAAIAVGLMEGPRFGAGFGLAAGMVMATIGHQGLLCIPALSLIGWVCGLLAQKALRRDLAGFGVCAVILGLIWEAVVLLSHFGEAALPLLLKIAGGELLCTLIFSFPVYWAARFCCVNYGRIYHE